MAEAWSLALLRRGYIGTPFYTDVRERTSVGATSGAAALRGPGTGERIDDIALDSPVMQALPLG